MGYLRAASISPFGAVLLFIMLSPAGAETFAERWPTMAAIVDPNIINPVDQEAEDFEARRRAVHDALQKVRRQLVNIVDPPKDLCRRQTYHVGHHRYWRCRR